MLSSSKLALVGALSFTAAIGCSASRTVATACDPQAATRQFSAPWQELSDSQMRIEVERACGRVFVGFKEADAVRGVDAQGRNLTASATVARMKSYLIERGVAFEFEFDLPSVTARMPARLDLVSELRRHSNIDYLEPIFPGSWAAK